MGRLITIGELAIAASVPASTVRYYERQGILAPSRRSASNYRLYSEHDVYRLRFIRAAKSSGFTLDDITELLRPAPCRNVQELIRERLQRVELQIRELRHIEDVLHGSLEVCREHEESGRCGVIDTLSASARPEETR